MDDVLHLLEKVGLRKLRAAIRQEPIGRGGREPVARLEMVVKIGTPRALKRERSVYVRFARFLKKEERRVLFPNTAFGMASATRAVLAVEPVGEKTLEEVVLGIIGVAEREGWRSKAVRMRQKFIMLLTKRALKKLAMLHRPIKVGNPQRELRLFTEELSRGLAESLRNAGMQWNTTVLKNKKLQETGVVSLAHRDLGLPNIMVSGEKDVFFIDPRAHVVSTPGKRTGATFASPIFDFVAFSVGLARSELEIQQRQTDFRLFVKRRVQREIAKMLRAEKTTPFLFHLSEAVVWAGYAACQCSQCRDPQRAWLRMHAMTQTKKCLMRLGCLE